MYNSANRGLPPLSSLAFNFVASIPNPSESEPPAASVGGGDRTLSGFICGVEGCHLSFTTKIGLSQHQRQAHEKYYHEKISTRVSHKRKRWTDEENILLAKMFIELTAKNYLKKDIAKECAVRCLPGRTPQSLLMRFKGHEFQCLVRELEREQLASAREEVPPPAAETGVDNEAESFPSWEVTFAGHLPEGIGLTSASPGVSTDANRQIVDDHYALFNVKHPPSQGAYVPSRPRPVQVTRFVGNARKRKARIYRRVQSLYSTNKGRLADEVLKGTWMHDPKAVDPVSMETYWRGIFETPSTPDARNPSCLRGPRWEVVEPVTEDDVLYGLKDVAGDTAAGPDGRVKKDIKGTPATELARMFNLWLYLGSQPSELVQSFTTFVPKVVGTDDPAQHRPISVSSMLVRLFHRVLARRLEQSCPVDVRQKGFRPGDGIAQNIRIVKTILRDHRMSNKRLFMAFLDVRKAFDSVSHESLVKACIRMGVPPPLLAYIKHIYQQASTVLKLNGCLSQPVRVLQGVKQGDPLSSVLFNFIIDWCVASMEQGIGAKLGKVRVSYCAFADDLVIFAESRDGLVEQANRLAVSLASVGLKLNSAKCATMGIDRPPRKKQWVADPKPFLILGGEKVPAISIESGYKYLGLHFSFAGAKEQITRKLNDLLTNLTKAPLKPEQRLWILRTKLLPSLHHELMFAQISLGLLKDMDRRVRAALRSWLKLPRDTPVPYFHARVKDGGLGIACHEFRIPYLRLQRLLNLTSCTDPVVREAVAHSSFGSECQKWGEQRYYRGLDASSPQLAEAAWRKALYDSVDGKGLRDASFVPCAHSWIESGNRTVTGRRFAAAVALRGGLLPTPARCARGFPDARVHCETCGPNVRETLNHQLQSCPRTHGPRIARHDKLVSLLVKQLSNAGYTVQSELRIKTSAGLRKPDILAYKKNMVAWILDVTGVADNIDLILPYEQKVEKYSSRPEISEWVTAVAGVPPKFGAFVLNYRGIYAPSTYYDMTYIGLTRRNLSFLAAICVEQGAVVHRIGAASAVGARFRNVGARNRV